MKITKESAKQTLDVGTDAALAVILGLTRQAIHAWPQEREMPEPYRWMLYGLFPDKFPSPERTKNG